MTRTGSAKSADKQFAIGRLRKARAFQKALDRISTFHDEVEDSDILVTLAILSAIAFTDAMTAAVDGKASQGNHQSAPRRLRDALGNALPDAQYRRLVGLLGQKDQTSYGANIGRGDPSEILENLNRFAEFAEEVLIRYRVSIPN